MKARMPITWRRMGGQWATILVPLLVVFLSTSPRAHGDYIESFQTWQSTSAGAWQVKDLSGAPFNVPPLVVVEVAMLNTSAANTRSVGVRAVGSGLERRFLLRDAENGGEDHVVMHVQTDINSQIEHYAQNTNNVTFVLLGYWECGTFVETFTSFTAGADASWQTHNLSTEGVSANEIAEIVLANKNGTIPRQAGVRANGSGLSRLLDVHKAEGGGVDTATMFVQADGTASAVIEAYAEIDADVDFHVVGYWTTTPGTYTQKINDVGSPSMDGTWENLDLSSYGVSGGDVAEFALANNAVGFQNEMGVRANGSSLGRLLDLQEAEGGGGDFGRMHVPADGSSIIEFYHEDISDAHTFHLTGYWTPDDVLTLSNHTAGQESDAFTEKGSETDAELFAFKLSPNVSSITVTQIVFRLTNISQLVDGDWGSIEIIEDDNNDGNISGSETTDRGGPGTVDTSAGTITFSTSFSVTVSTNYILRADFSSLSGGDEVTIDLSESDISGTFCVYKAISDATTAITHTEVDILGGLVAYYKLNETSGTTATDASGQSNDGTITGPQPDTGMFGGGLLFDGSNDYVDVPTSIVGSDVGAVSLWVRTSTDFADVAHVYYGSSAAAGDGEGTDSELHLNFTSGENIQLFIEGGASDVSITSSSTYADGNWHHVAATWDVNGNAVLYVDGSSVGSATHDANNFVFSSVHRLGRPGASSRYWTGRMDDVRVYNRVLNSTEVQTLARGWSLIAHWKFDESSGATATDSAGGNDASLLPDEPTGPQWTTGKLCGALTFDGDNQPDGDRLDVSGIVRPTAAFTYALWFKPTTTHSSGSGGATLLEGKSGLRPNMDLTNNGDLLMLVNVGGINFNDVKTTTTSWSSSTWHHIAITWDGTDFKIYVNGTQEGSTITHAGAHSASTGLFLGQSTSGSARFAGEIDDVRIYSRALTAAEVQGLAATYLVVDLGSLNGISSLGCKINNSEQVAGFDEDGSGDPSAWVSQYCAFTSLGTLTGGSIAEARGINNAGEVVGWSDETGGNRHAFKWTSGGGMTDLGTVTGLADSDAFAINASSEVAGTSMDFGLPTDNRVAFLYLPSPAYSLPAGMNSLGTLGGNQSVGFDLNDSGETVGGAQVSGENMKPFLWLPSAAYGLSAGMNSLGTLGGESPSILHRAQAINTSAEVVGLSYTSAGAAHAFIWLPAAAYTLSAGINDLGVLTGGTISLALDISDSGIVVGTSDVSGGAYHAFVWESGTMTDLNNLIDSSAGWTLTRATGINTDGEIAGWGTNQRGDVHAFVLTQTCSTSATQSQTGGGGFGASLATGVVITDSLGAWDETAVSTEGETLARITVSDAEPGDSFEYLVAAPASDSDGAPGPSPGTVEGFEDGIALANTLIVETDAPAGSYIVTVSMMFTADEIFETGLRADELELYVLDESQDPPPGVWVPAGSNIGESEPTGIVGESGYSVGSDDGVEYWAVRAAPSVFAVGAMAAEDTVDPWPVPNFCGSCGAGMLQMLLPALAFLTMVKTMRRRFR